MRSGLIDSPPHFCHPNSMANLPPLIRDQIKSLVMEQSGLTDVLAITKEVEKMEDLFLAYLGYQVVGQLPSDKQHELVSMDPEQQQALIRSLHPESTYVLKALDLFISQFHGNT